MAYSAFQDGGGRKDSGTSVKSRLFSCHDSAFRTHALHAVCVVLQSNFSDTE